MKKNENDLLALSGTIAGINFSIGVENPYNGRRGTVLGPRHLQALRVLLTFADASRLNQSLPISKAEFIGRFGEKDAWSVLISLLVSWVRTSTADGVAFSDFAAVSFFEKGGNTTAFVRFGEDIIPVLKRMSESMSSNYLDNNGARRRPGKNPNQ